MAEWFYAFACRAKNLRSIRCAASKKGRREEMPIRKIGNKWQYGTTGKKYASRAKAVAQGRAIKISQLKRGKKIK